MSSTGVGLNVRTRDATFKLGELVVHGSFLTEAHFVARTRVGRLFNVSFSADALNEQGYGWRAVKGSCALPRNVVPFTLGPHRRRVCDDLVAIFDYSTLRVETADWTFVVTGHPVYDRLEDPHHRLDVRVQRKTAVTAAPHGIIGQSFGDSKRRIGRTDLYSSHKVAGNFTTTAMAEDAIDGRADDYVMQSSYAVDFAFSRWRASPPNGCLAPRRGGL